MPHDVNGQVLAVGDVVTIECRVTELQQGEDYCNVTVETVHGRRPDGLKEQFSSINTGVVQKKDASCSPPDELLRFHTVPPASGG